jgi:hypothetical protein
VRAGPGAALCPCERRGAQGHGQWP